MAAWAWPFSIEATRSDLSPADAERSREMFTGLVARHMPASTADPTRAGGVRHTDAFSLALGARSQGKWRSG